jgi:HSP20 family protein
MKLVPRRKRTELTPDVGVSGPLWRLRDEVDRLFSRFFGDWGEFTTPSGGAAGRWWPEIDVVEGERDITVRAEIPGLDPKDIDVSVTGNVLTISGEKKEEKEETRGSYYQAERRYGAFHRAVELPPGANPDQVTADYDKGVISIRIGKEEKAQPKRIPVSPRKEGVAEETEKKKTA